MVDSMVKVGSVEPEPEPDDFQSHEELSFENFQSLPSAQSPVQPSENVMVEMIEKSIQTDNRVKTVCDSLLSAAFLSVNFLKILV